MSKSKEVRVAFNNEVTGSVEMQTFPSEEDFIDELRKKKVGESDVRIYQAQGADFVVGGVFND